MIYIRDVQVVKSGEVLFQHFSWEIKAGENWVIDGNNGCGKTTLLELLAGLIHASHGEVEYDFINGETWEERFSDKKKKIKLIPAHASHSLFGTNPNGLYYQQRYYASNNDGKKVRDFFGEGMDAIRALNIPASLSIDLLLNREVTRLSNGQLKKVLLLQSLLHGIPRLLLLDYPFEGLDIKSREELARFIDFISNEYTVQIIMTDHTCIPSVMNRKMTLDNFAIVGQLQSMQDTAHEIAEGKLLSEAKPKGTPVVEIKNLTIQYGDTSILRNFSWTVYQGDRWALLGRNGSGKTTLFSLIFADHPMAYSQEIYLFGKRRGTGESIWDIKKRINYVGPELISYLNPKTIPVSAFDYVMSLHKKPDAAKLEELIHFFEADTFFAKPVKALSSGQLQLMLLVNCFLERKEILLLDEPFQFLDPFHKERIREYLSAQLDKKITLILITHHDQDIVNWTEKTMTI